VEKRVVLGADDDVPVQVVVLVGNGGGAEPPAPVITSDDPLLSTCTTPRASTCQMAAHIFEVCPANMTDCNLRESKPRERRPPGKT